MAIARTVLTINAGSSSIKFALYDIAPTLTLSMRGELRRIGIGGTTLSWTTKANGPKEQPVDTTAEDAPRFLADWLATQQACSSMTAAGHRIVHGLARTAPVRISPDIMAELHRAQPYAPDHLPREIATIEALRSRSRDLPQVACFDTAFHAGMPRVARQLPIPRRYYAKGVHRYGFHGLSYQYLMEELAHIAGKETADKRVVLAHLGSGSSLAAVNGGSSIDTSMGFSPASGLVMSTRTGDLDPGVVSFLAQNEGMTASEFHRMVNYESGLLGVSEFSPDMQDLLAREAEDVRAAEAVELFCYQARKWVGAFAAALGGLDTLVFSAGIGERSAPIRARICEGLDFLGIGMDDARNRANAPVISADASRVSVRIIPTDEELMIARSVSRVLGLDTHSQERDV